MSLSLILLYIFYLYSAPQYQCVRIIKRNEPKADVLEIQRGNFVEWSHARCTDADFTKTSKHLLIRELNIHAGSDCQCCVLSLVPRTNSNKYVSLLYNQCFTPAMTMTPRPCPYSGRFTTPDDDVSPCQVAVTSECKSVGRLDILSSCYIRPGGWSLLKTQYSILNTQYSILNTRYSILDTQCSILSAQCSVLSAQCSVLSTQYSVLSTQYITQI